MPMSSDPAAPRTGKPRSDFGARLAVYCASGILSGPITVVAATLLELYYVDFLESGETFTTYCQCWSPLDRPFWDYTLARLPALLGGGVIGSIFGTITGCDPDLWSKWGEITCCALFWGMLAGAFTLILILAGVFRTPKVGLLMMPAYLALGLVYGTVLGVSVRLLENLRARIIAHD
jgi:hypothetical protein